MKLEPVTLEGRVVRLEPMSMGHHAALCGVALDEGLWEWTPTALRTPDDLRTYIDKALARQQAGVALPFTTIERERGRVVGMTRFANYVEKDRRVEIGWTTVGRAWQRTGVNTEAKYLMLRHAFEALGLNRVELKTDVLNVRSRRAIVRIGAKEEGVLRQHMVTESGRVRDTVYYSIVRDEWADVKARLEGMMAR